MKYSWKTNYVLICLISLIVVQAGCLRQSDQEVVVYCALDKEFSDSILKQFEAETNIKVLAKFDQESNKTVGLANEIIQQGKRQRCDLFWNNEILHTIRLQQLGLLDVYVSPLKDQYPAQFVSGESGWYGFAARARVLLINTDLLPDKELWPTSVNDLVDIKWKGKCALAKPFFGTTATHAAVLYSKWGNERANKFFKSLAENASVENGNKQVAINVARGRYAFGLTDTDDAIIEIEQGNPVAIVFPDQGAGQDGTLLVPNTICLPKNGPNSENAVKLVDFLLQQKIEEQLARGRSAQFPLNLNSNLQSRIQIGKLKIMPVDFEAAAENWGNVKQRLKTFFPL